MVGKEEHAVVLSSFKGLGQMRVSTGERESNVGDI